MIYFFDGSKEAFLTAFLLAYGDENAVLTAGICQLALGQKSVFVRAEPDKARRCAARLRELDGKCMQDLDLILRSGDADRGQIAFLYLQLIAVRKRPVRGELADDAVSAAAECIRRVRLEVHRLKGFVRFLECACGALYAPLSPDHDVCNLLLPHFKSRIPAIPFVLHDVRRAKAAVWDGKHAFCAPLEKAQIVLAADEPGWQALWREYYASVNIPSRRRLAQMKGYMPVRYWKFLTELAPDVCANNVTTTNASLPEAQDASLRPNGSPRSRYGSDPL